LKDSKIDSKPNRDKANTNQRLHARNKNNKPYDLKALTIAEPKLKEYLIKNKLGEDSVNFSSAKAVKLLNKALLNHYYGIKFWDFPDDNLCPPVPGRADYIHHMADVLSENNLGEVPTGNKITCLDVGVGANCIYPVIGVTEYQWQFYASDIHEKSISSAEHIINANPQLTDKVICRLQKNKSSIFKDIIEKSEKIDLVFCNPPFHTSAEAAMKEALRKEKNLTGKKVTSPNLNFSGISEELIYEGGEYQFIHNMIQESKLFSKSCLWFSTLVSKQTTLKPIYKWLKLVAPAEIKTIELTTGNKSSRIIAWSFLIPNHRDVWRKRRW